MAEALGSVTIGTGGGQVVLVADVGAYRPFGREVALGVRVYDGVGDSTIHDFGFRANRQEGALSAQGIGNPGLISTATLAALFALLTAWGVSQPFVDSLGNEGTIKAVRFTHAREYGVPGSQGVLYSYDLTWRWVTLTKLYTATYSGP